ncbi:hypothetical protein PRIPAC_72429 [Pristionchus pacificus]|uniref:Membrane transporter n=1 Tax=Pristionchus pacificus TaxID=54126 RepID=A0A2A6C649_PRIPA|nr:hypothetical protein PRIPAC_72429 [Pristionchus pacificus]|eukprot:PDM73629.1 membrane transporter [Pristionchus pacificus]
MDEPHPFRARDKKEVLFYTHYEEVLARVRPFGPYQIFCCIVILYASIEWAGNATFMDTLGSEEPDWNCTLKDGSGFLKIEDDDTDKCERIKDCSELIPIANEFFSVRAKFQLICDNDYVPLIQIIMAGGSLIGALVGGHIGDAFGRQTLFFVGQLLLIITSMMVTASQGWVSFAVIMGVNCLIYGLLETTALTMMMEYTSNKFRIIHAACFQWPIAYMVMALIAYLTKDWQSYFVFLNLVASPLAIGFMLFHESPRWLIARNKLDEACSVLNDLAHERWNNTKAKFTTRDISTISKTHTSPPYYTIFSLFANRRLAKQTFMQFVSAFTYSIVSSTYIYTTSTVHDDAIMYTLLDGIFRLFTPIIIIFLDYRFKAFGRKMQFIGALTIEAILFAIIIVLIATGSKYDDLGVVIIIIVTTMINDCVFWINIIQVTTQRYPTVIRCMAFGFIQAVKHFGAIVGVLALQPVLQTYSLGAFIIPEVLIIITLVLGFFLQPETKGKALMDQMIEANYGRLENAIPKALIKLAAGHKVVQMERREELRKDMEAAEAAIEKGKLVDSPWTFKGDSHNPSRKTSTMVVPQGDVFELEVIKTLQSIPDPHMGSRKQTKSSLKEYENRAYNYDDDTEDYAREFKKEKERKFHEKELELEARSRRNSAHSANWKNPSWSDNDASDLDEIKM